MTNLKSLHLFDNYLPQTENWAYNLISSLPNCDIIIGAKVYLKNNFYDPDFHYIDNPVGELTDHYSFLDKRKPGQFLKKVFIKIIPFVLKGFVEDLVKYGTANHVDIVHAHFANIGWDFRAVPKRLNKPFLISFYGWDYEKLPHTKPKFRKRFKTLFEVSDGFICEGNHGASILESYGCPKTKIFVVRLGVRPDKIPVIKRMKERNRLKLVQVASFTEKKGQVYAIEAVAKLIETCPNLKLTFIGNDGGYQNKTKLENMVRERGLESCIHFQAAIDYKDLYSSLADFDVFIHPSCYTEDRDCEGGAPVVLLDAQATGMPVIATEHCDIPDEVIHGETGMLSPEKNTDLLAEHIKTFYEMDNTNYQVFAEKARAHIEQNYNISDNAKVLQEVYHKVIN